MVPLRKLFVRDAPNVTQTAMNNVAAGPPTDRHSNDDQSPAPIAPNESRSNDVPPGYPKLAEQMGHIPQAAVFRRFAYLNKLNLLHLQAELVGIENNLKKIQQRDSQGLELEQLYAKDWFFLNNAPSEGGSDQFKLLLSAREKLERYNMALIQQSHILPMKIPSKMDLTYIQDFISSKEMGPFALEGEDSEVWGNIHNRTEHASDIITLLPRKKEDMFSRLLKVYGVRKWFEWGLGKFRKPSKVTGLVAYEESTLVRLTFLITTALASLLPIVSIVALYYVHSMKARLGVIAAFNVLISVCLAFFTSAKRTEIFAVTAAFAAVQVVFVQVDGGCGV